MPGTNDQPTDEQRRLAAEFGAWQKSVRTRAGLNMRDFANKAGIGESTVRLYDGESYSGIDNNGKYRRPKLQYIKAIGDAFKLDERTIVAGQVAAGLVKVLDVPMVAATGSADRDFAQRLRDIASQIESGDQTSAEFQRLGNADSREIVELFEGIPAGPLREDARAYLRDLNDLAKRRYKNRTDIIGKPADGPGMEPEADE